VSANMVVVDPSRAAVRSALEWYGERGFLPFHRLGETDRPQGRASGAASSPAACEWLSVCPLASSLELLP